MGKFQPGRSGNPKGRPKGARNAATQFLEQMHAPANGVAMSKIGAIIRTHISQAMDGDHRAIRDVLDRLWKLEERWAAAERAIPFTDADREVIAEICARLVIVVGGRTPEAAA